MIELKVMTSTYKEVVIDEEVHEVVDKKNLIIRKLVHEKDITSVQEVLNSKSVPYKTRCMVHIANEGHMIVKHSYEYLKQLKNGATTVGFFNS
jgi:hypothetical protein